MRDMFAAAVAAAMVLVAAGAATASRPVQDYLERASSAVAAQPPVQIARG